MQDKEIYTVENKNSLEIILKRLSIVGIIVSLILTGIIAYLSVIPGEKLKAVSLLPFEDKGAHILAYAVLGVFLYFSFVRVSFKMHYSGRDLMASKWIILPSVFTIVTGVIIGTILEFVQKTVNRQFEVLDIVADGLGLLVGCTIGYYILKIVLKITLNKDL